MIGAGAASGVGFESGAVYLFDLEENSLHETLKVTASDAAAGARFGQAVAVYEHTFFVGADLDDLDDLDSPGGEDAGAAYVYTVPEPAGALLLAAALGTLVCLRLHWRVR